MSPHFQSPSHAALSLVSHLLCHSKSSCMLPSTYYSKWSLSFTSQDVLWFTTIHTVINAHAHTSKVGHQVKSPIIPESSFDMTLLHKCKLMKGIPERNILYSIKPKPKESIYFAHTQISACLSLLLIYMRNCVHTVPGSPLF